MLKAVLLGNALSCFLFGALFLFAAPDSVAFLGNPPLLLIQFLGAGLLINALFLTITALRKTTRRQDVLLFALGDAVWVLTTGGLLITGLWITTPTGIVWTLGVGLFVAICGLAQWRLAPKI